MSINSKWKVVEYLCHDILYACENQQSTVTYNMGEPPTYDVEQKKPDQKYMIFYSVYIKLETGKTKSGG